MHRSSIATCTHVWARQCNLPGTHERCGCPCSSLVQFNEMRAALCGTRQRTGEHGKVTVVAPCPLVERL